MNKVVSKLLASLHSLSANILYLFSSVVQKRQCIVESHVSPLLYNLSVLQVSLLQTEHLMSLVPNHYLSLRNWRYRLLTSLQNALNAEQLQVVFTKCLVLLVLMMRTSLLKSSLILPTRCACMLVRLHWLLGRVHQRELGCLSRLCLVLVTQTSLLLLGIPTMVIGSLGGC